MSFEDYYWLNKDSRTFLSREYLPEGVSPEQRIRTICDRAEEILGIKGFADKFERYMKKGWISLSTPIWCNFGAGRALPISCNGSYVADTMESILGKASEIGMMSKNGAGTSAFFGHLRPRGSTISIGGKSSGPVHFMEIFDKVASVVSQAGTRRGQFSAYLPVEHPDILEFLQIRSEGNPIQRMSIGVTITNQWMNGMLSGDKDKQKIWAKIIQKKFESGFPYIFFTDNVNDNAPQVYKDKGMKIRGSQICTEICLFADEKNSFVCNLLSLNALHFFDWKDTDLVQVVTFFLDAVMEEYIQKTKDIPFMGAAHNFAKTQRALGIGVLGWHSLLQSQMIPFESVNAMSLNVQIFKTIQEKSIEASKELAKRYGEPELLRGYGLRNVCLQAVAPTTSSSFILGQVSPSIEPLNGNYFVKNLDKGKFTYKNPYLKEVLRKYNKDTKEVWDNILIKGGSVQHIDFLSDLEKEVFKTFIEISQKTVVDQAASRQKYIDQSQSLNFMIHSKTSPKEVSKLMIYAWENGVKTLYYQRGQNAAQELGRQSLLECKACEA